MGWTEFGKVEQSYNESFRNMDENLLKMLNERKKLANGKRFFPPVEQMEEWAKNYDMELAQISWFMHSLQDGSTPFRMPKGPGELLSVSPIMKKTQMDDFHYLLTHAMQHEHGTIVHLEIKHIHNDEGIGHIRPQLMLHIDDKENFYHVNRDRGHGSGGKTELSFLVSPRLPDDMSKVNFALIPYSMPMELPPKEVILNKEVRF